MCSLNAKHLTKLYHKSFNEGAVTKIMHCLEHKKLPRTLGGALFDNSRIGVYYTMQAIMNTSVFGVQRSMKGSTTVEKLVASLKSCMSRMQNISK